MSKKSSKAPGDSVATYDVSYILVLSDGRPLRNIDVQRSPDDDGWIATLPDKRFPSLSYVGHSFDSAAEGLMKILITEGLVSGLYTTRLERL